MLNLKLKTIANLIDKNDSVIDIGCDHAYLAIYLKENHLCKNIYASDISKNVLKIAKENIKDLDIPLYLSNGFDSIPKIELDTVVISGMGSSTIINIIDHAPDKIKKYIISSNNNHYELRTYIIKNGYYIEKEIVIKDKNKYYPIIVFLKGTKKESKKTLKYGKSSNIEYFNDLLKKEVTILNNIPKSHFIERLKHIKTKKELKDIIKRK